MYQIGWLHLVLFSGVCLRLTAGQCGEGTSLYPFGDGEDDFSALGDDGPSGVVLLEDGHPGAFFRFYAYDYTKVYFNLNGQISFGQADRPFEDMSMVEFFPSSSARPDPPFMTAFWNDLFLNGNNGTLFYRMTTDPAILQKAHDDIGFKDKVIQPTLVLIATWDQVSSFDEVYAASRNTSAIPQHNIYQIVIVMDDEGLSFAMFNYFLVDWYLSHSLPAVAMFNRGRGTSDHTNLYASGSELMLELDDVCANGGVYGRFIIQTNLERIRILDQPSPSVIAMCYLKENSLYPYGSDVDDAEIIFGDDGPAAVVKPSSAVKFYGQWFDFIFININGPISFGDKFPNYIPTSIPFDEPPFMAAFWNDIRLSGTGEDGIYYRLTTDAATIERFKGDAGSIGGDMNPEELLIVTWHQVKMFRAFDDDPFNTFQVVFGYDGDRSYTLFLYAYIGWYQDINGNFAVSLFNKGAATKVSIDVGPPPGPAFFFRQQRGNSVNKPGMFIYETHPPLIMKQSPTCVCKVNGMNWVTTYDGKKHAFKHAQKNRMSKYLDDTDPCKFQLSIVTELTSFGNYKILWVAFSFGIHENNESKLDKSLAFERFSKGTVVIRGRGYSGAEEISTPWEWTSTDNRTHVTLVGDSDSGWVVNSTTCPYRLLFAPKCPDPVVVFTLNKGTFKAQHLVGMCQDCNDDPENDYRPCSNDPVEEWAFWEEIPDLSAVCVDDD